jgi:hypothetical protein
MLFGQLPRLPFAQGKQRRFRQREKETCARENQYRHHRRRHARSVKQIARRKKQKEAQPDPSAKRKRVQRRDAEFAEERRGKQAEF